MCIYLYIYIYMYIYSSSEVTLLSLTGAAPLPTEGPIHEQRGERLRTRRARFVAKMATACYIISWYNIL
jgi:hypothetical protein